MTERLPRFISRLGGGGDQELPAATLGEAVERGGEGGEGNGYAACDLIGRPVLIGGVDFLHA
jgi:hypothetical protein